MDAQKRKFSGAKAKILLALYESKQPEMYGLEVARATGIASSNVYQTLAKLEDDGMVILRRGLAESGKNYPPRVYCRLSDDGIGAARDLPKMSSIATRPRGPAAPETRVRVMGVLFEAWPNGVDRKVIVDAVDPGGTKVYSALAGLAKKGLVELSAQLDEHGVAQHRTRVLCRLTDAGFDVANMSEPAARYEGVNGQKQGLSKATTEALLALLGANPVAISAADIEDATDVDRGALRSALTQLTEWGWVTQARTSGQRIGGNRSLGDKVCYRLTEFGLEAAERPAAKPRGRKPTAASVRGRVLLALYRAQPSELYGLQLANLLGASNYRTYEMLSVLVEQGLVDVRSEVIDPSEKYRPHRLYYRLTQAGAATARSIAKAPVAPTGSRKQHNHGARWRILTLLDGARTSWMCCPDVAEITNTSRSRAWKHLNDLAECGLVETKQKPVRIGSTARPATVFRITSAGTVAARAPGDATTAKLTPAVRQAEVPEQVLQALSNSAPSEMYVSDIHRSVEGCSRVQLRRVLAWLVESGLIESRRETYIPGDKYRPPRIYYRLTEAGIRAADKKTHRSAG